MKTWTQRPVEAANLYNPAFTGLLLWSAIDSYTQERQNPMPFELVFLILPLILTESTRRSLPTMRTSLHTWLQRNPAAKIRFAERTSAMAPWTKEALLFMVQRGLIVTEGVNFRPAGAPVRGLKPYMAHTEGLSASWLKARFVGRWLAGAGTSHTIYALWGIRP